MVFRAAGPPPRAVLTRRRSAELGVLLVDISAAGTTEYALFAEGEIQYSAGGAPIGGPATSPTTWRWLLRTARFAEAERHQSEAGLLPAPGMVAKRRGSPSPRWPAAPSRIVPKNASSVRSCSHAPRSCSLSFREDFPQACGRRGPAGRRGADRWAAPSSDGSARNVPSRSFDARRPLRPAHVAFGGLRGRDQQPERWATASGLLLY